MKITNLTLKSLILALASLSAGIALYWYLRSEQTIETANSYSNNPPLIVGTASGYAPFVSINADGQYEGFDIDVAKALAQQLNRPLEIRDLGSMSPLFLALEQNQIDMIIWGLSITSERLQRVAMVHYWGDNTTSFPLIFWEKIPAQVKTIHDMQNFTVCVEPASVQDAVLSEYPFINRKFTEKVDDALLNIQYGKADAALVEPAIARKFQLKHPQLKILDLPLTVDQQIQGLGIAIKQTNQQLISQVQQAVKNLTDQGKIAQLARQWEI